MEHYRKGRNVEEILEKEEVPIPDLPVDFLWMHVTPGAKVWNVMSVALQEFKRKNVIVWSGSGPALEKTITCTEIMKKRYKTLHQITKICFRKVEEYWEPQLEGLDELVIVREIPTIHIVLSKEMLNSSEPGYQAPRAVNAFRKASGQSSYVNPQSSQRNTQTDPKGKKQQKYKKSEQPKQGKPMETVPESSNHATSENVSSESKDNPSSHIT